MLSFFPRDILDEVLDLIESVSEGLPIHSMIPKVPVFLHYLYAVPVPLHYYKSDVL